MAVEPLKIDTVAEPLAKLEELASVKVRPGSIVRGAEPRSVARAAAVRVIVGEPGAAVPRFEPETLNRKVGVTGSLVVTTTWPNCGPTVELLRLTVNPSNEFGAIEPIWWPVSENPGGTLTDVRLRVVDPTLLTKNCTEFWFWLNVNGVVRPSRTSLLPVSSLIRGRPAPAVTWKLCEPSCWPSTTTATCQVPGSLE